MTGVITVTSVPDWPAQLESISTAVAAAAAIVAGTFAVLAFRKQSQQLASQRRFEESQSIVLALQADELRESLTGRRREQANHVTLEVTIATRVSGDQDQFMRVGLTFRNGSDRSIYEIAQFAWIGDDPWVGDKSVARRVGFLPAHQKMGVEKEIYCGKVHDLHRRAEDLRFLGLFRDHAGRWWHIEPGGLLLDITDQVRAEGQHSIPTQNTVGVPVPIPLYDGSDVDREVLQ